MRQVAMQVAIQLGPSAYFYFHCCFAIGQGSDLTIVCHRLFPPIRNLSAAVDQSIVGRALQSFTSQHPLFPAIPHPRGSHLVECSPNHRSRAPCPTSLGVKGAEIGWLPVIH
mmetsp:Transcript_54254/g.118706  ORF Transcript_54254/g.118706 Transcript_54254/m.118706 type:complete len:112 (-) Transcript_54254:19-354(-)